MLWALVPDAVAALIAEGQDAGVWLWVEGESVATVVGAYGVIPTLIGLVLGLPPVAVAAVVVGLSSLIAALIQRQKKKSKKKGKGGQEKKPSEEQDKPVNPEGGGGADKKLNISVRLSRACFGP